MQNKNKPIDSASSEKKTKIISSVNREDSDSFDYATTILNQLQDRFNWGKKFFIGLLLLIKTLKQFIVNSNLIRYIQSKYRFGRKVQFKFSSKISDKSVFEGANKIGSHTIFDGKMGFGSYIGWNSEISANIGRYTSIAPWVRVNNGVHPLTYPYIATSPMFYSTQKQNGYSFTKKNLFKEFVDKVIIGNDVWINENVFLVGGINIGDGAIVLAGAVVTKDVPPYAIVGGVPAKILRYRYSEEDIKFLLNLKWWNKDANWLCNNYELLLNIDKLKDIFQK